MILAPVLKLDRQVAAVVIFTPDCMRISRLSGRCSTSQMPTGSRPHLEFTSCVFRRLE
jgi:hypothetical protein